MKRKYANVGEKVKLIEPLAFIRCGYPLCSGEIDKNPELNKRKWQLVNAAAEAMFPKEPKRVFGLPVLAIGDFFGSVRDDNTLHFSIDPRIASKLEAAANMAILIQEGFGGKERQVFESPCEDPWGSGAGIVFEVTKKRFVKTGTRFEGRERWDYFGDHDYEPAGLANEQTHCVYQLDGWFETLAKNTERI